MVYFEEKLMSPTTLERRTTTSDSRVLHEAAQRGKRYLIWPQDEDWLSDVDAKPLARLAGMTSRGSLARIAQRRWVILPSGASSPRQAASQKVLLAALLDGRAEWYLGFLSALIDHGLTDEHSDDLYVAVRRTKLPSKLVLDGRTVHVANVTRESWVGLERVRAEGRVFIHRSDLEKTLLDALDRPDLCGYPELWVRSWERAFREDRVDTGRLLSHAGEMSIATQARCAYWLRELGQPGLSRLMMKTLGGAVTGPRFLDASRSYQLDSASRDRETGLVVNLPERAITGWLNYGK